MSSVSPSGARTAPNQGRTAPLRELRVLPGGRTAVTTGDAGQVELWNISPHDGRWSHGESLVGHSAPVVQAEVSADGRSLLTGSSDGQLVTWT